MTSLSDKLKALGVRTGARREDRADGRSISESPDFPTAGRPSSHLRWAHPIEQIVPGRLQDTAHGEAFLVETSYPLDHRQGCSSLCVTSPPSIVAEWAREPRLDVEPPQGFAFLDTETTGLAGGTGTYAFLVGVGRCDGKRFHLTQFFLRDPGHEPALLSALSEYLQSSGVLVTFNGKSFDLPLLDARYITNGRTSPLPSLAHLDLLPLARRLWRDRLPSRALGSLEQYILGVARNQEDVPGWMIPQLYFSYLRSGDARPLKSVFYHNAMDVLSMAALLSHIGGLLDDPFGQRSIHALDLLGMGKLFESLGHADTAMHLFERALSQRALANDLPASLRQRVMQRLSFIQKRRDNWPAAIDLWQQAAGEGEIYAHVELAKYYEHRLCDLSEATRWTIAALQRVTAPGYPHASRQRWLANLEHRLARVRRKASQEPPSRAAHSDGTEVAALPRQGPVFGTPREGTD
jgi:uncharacterized protein YprB with RNaseH-like and TPR domain